MVREPRPPREQGDWIGDFAVAVDRAGARNRRGADRSSEQAWSDLIAGRVRVVSRFDRDGRRFIVARRTDTPTQAGVSPLTPRELAAVEHRVRGAPLKAIAPALGVSISTVAKSLQRALFKLGIENQAELVAVLGSAAIHADLLDPTDLVDPPESGTSRIDPSARAGKPGPSRSSAPAKAKPPARPPVRKK